MSSRMGRLWGLILGVGVCAAGAAAGADLREHVREVRRYTFEEPDDRNFDFQPDGWSRRKGPNFPEYVHSQIDRTAGHASRHSLRFELNGATAAYYSPLIPIERAKAYLLQGFARTSGLRYDGAVISLSILDAQRRRIQRHLSRMVSGSSDWTELEIGPVPIPEQARFLVIGCHVAGNDRHDVRGHVWFDDLWLGALPRLILSTSDGRSYYRPGEPLELVAQVKGELSSHPYEVTIRLEDEQGQVRDSTSHAVSSPGADKTAETDAPDRVHWKLPALRNGFYRAVASFGRAGNVVLETRATFAVLDAPRNNGAPGEFGWSLTNGPGRLPLAKLSEIAPEAGLGWLKLPLWSAANGPDRPEFDVLLDALEKQGISLVGMLSDPPASLVEKFAQRRVAVSKVFLHSRDLWGPSLEPIVARYAFRVRHWQLGHEDDASFVGVDSLPATLSQVKRDFDRVGHDSRIGARWTWEPPYPAADSRLGFLSLVHSAGKSPEDLSAALKTASQGTIPRWVVLEPASRGQGTTDERVADLVRRMLAAKIGGAEGLFAADPLDAEKGLIQDDGSPAELFLPWRTYSLALRGTTFAGSLELPGQSPNAVFRRGNEAIVAIWNSRAMTEELFLGDGARAVDVWGRSTPLPLDERTGRQTLKAGPMPQLIVGASDSIIRWRLAMKFERGKIPSEYGTHEETLLVTNTFPQGISGKAVLHLPPGWEVEPGSWPVQAGAGETVRLPMLVKFPVDASLGPFRLEVEFEVNADRPYKFSQPVNYQLGVGDVDLDVAVRRTPEGRLEIEQRITNKTEPLEELSFNCQLFVPGQIRQKQTATKVGRTVDTRLYHVANPDQLKTRDLWLQVEQIDGRRVLNRHIRVD